MAEGKIVVGVDGSDQSVRALHWAARQAGLTGAELVAVTAWEYPVWGGLTPETATYDPEREAAKVLTETVERALGAEAATQVTHKTHKGNAAEALLKQAESAAHLVVGARGYSGLKATVLGSVSLHVVQHSPVPVTVVRGE
ncbi:universal stress protein [Streptomyces spiroverticillatus]|uniref:Universal stress protein n=1 Tax=Streptomyces finlayi TaxID=67296 RepID=A0A918WU48_9ACTN|nr:universal stress protein [Streptomyces finlayi]GGZ98369.1 universal stress protein [Streptomyces spiroverticillatus]GHC83281.1 universal stress protein [Streptomyces finlayi]